ncbi:hypothetical protein JXL21_05925 [Candidatus Bathyarchaeota archaeon]|nr:hypothetical protein [Candidatus Bathyarchaeota archaeon]
MSDMIRENFEPGKWLLVSGIILSVVLMLQLYAINETVDISSLDTLLGENLFGLILIASYLLTTAAMITVVIEYFNVKKKVDGLLALTDLLDRIEDLQYQSAGQGNVETRKKTPTTQSYRPEEAEDEVEPELFEDEPEALDPLSETFSDLEIGEEQDERQKPAIATIDPLNYRTIEVKIDDEAAEEPEDTETEEQTDLEEEAAVNVLEELANQDLDEEEPEMEDEVEEMLQQSEVISTLSELEKVVEELKLKKPKAAPSI